MAPVPPRSRTTRRCRTLDQRPAKPFGRARRRFVRHSCRISVSSQHLCSAIRFGRAVILEGGVHVSETTSPLANAGTLRCHHALLGMAARRRRRPSIANIFILRVPAHGHEKLPILGTLPFPNCHPRLAKLTTSPFLDKHQPASS